MELPGALRNVDCDKEPKILLIAWIEVCRKVDDSSKSFSSFQRGSNKKKTLCFCKILRLKLDYKDGVGKLLTKVKTYSQLLL